MKKLTNLAAAAVYALVFMSGCASTKAEKSENIQPEQATKETAIIRLSETGGIIPATTVIKPGTTVIWVNDSRVQLQLQFSGTQVTLACKSPVHFVVDEAGSFVSDRIPEDAVASLCFIEKGEFPYVLRNVGSRATFEKARTRPQEFKGTIIVQ